MFEPEKVLLLARRVEEAAEIVIEPPAVRGMVLMVPRVPVRRLVPMEEVAMILPFWSTLKSTLANPVSQMVPAEKSVELALVKV